MNKKEKEIKKELSLEELLARCRATLVVLQMKSKMGQLGKTHQIKQLKKEIARLLTRQNQKNAKTPTKEISRKD